MALSVNRNRFGRGTIPMSYGGMGLPGYSYFGAQGPGFLRGSAAGPQAPAQAPQPAQQAQDNSPMLMQIIAQLQQNQQMSNEFLTNYIRQSEERRRMEETVRTNQQNFERQKQVAQGAVPNVVPQGSKYAGQNTDSSTVFYRGPDGKIYTVQNGRLVNQSAQASMSSVSDPGRISTEGGSGDKKAAGPNSPIIRISEGEAREIIGRPELAQLAKKLVELQKRGGLEIASGVTNVRPDFVQNLLGSLGGSGIGAPGGTFAGTTPPADPPPGPPPEPPPGPPSGPPAGGPFIPPTDNGATTPVVVPTDETVVNPIVEPTSQSFVPTVPPPPPPPPPPQVGPVETAVPTVSQDIMGTQNYRTTEDTTPQGVFNISDPYADPSFGSAPIDPFLDQYEQLLRQKDQDASMYYPPESTAGPY